MSNKVILIMLLALFFTGCSKNKLIFNETNQADFYLRNSQVYYQKSFSNNIGFKSVEKELKSKNTPNGGIQIYEITDDEVKGTIIGYQIDWVANNRKIKVPEVMKKPMNASFQIEKDGSGYKVTVQYFWFSVDKNNKAQINNQVENFILNKNRLSFTNNKNNIRIIHHLSAVLGDLFYLKSSGLRTDGF